MEVTLEISEKKASFFIELIKQFDFVQIKNGPADTPPYNPEFVAKIEKSRQDYKAGKGRTVTIEELNALWK